MKLRRRRGPLLCACGSGLHLGGLRRRRRSGRGLGSTKRLSVQMRRRCCNALRAEVGSSGEGISDDVKLAGVKQTKMVVPCRLFRQCQEIKSTEMRTDKMSISPPLAERMPVNREEGCGDRPLTCCCWADVCVSSSLLFYQVVTLSTSCSTRQSLRRVNLQGLPPRLFGNLQSYGSPHAPHHQRQAR